MVATLTAVFFLLSAAQTLHALFLAARKSGRPVSAATVYEALLVVHLYLATATMLSAYANHGTLLLHLRVTALPLSALLWFNLALAVVGLTLAIRYRKPVMTWEIALFALCSPPVIDAAGTFAPYLFIADAAFLTFRVSAGLILTSGGSATASRSFPPSRPSTACLRALPWQIEAAACCT